MRVRLRVVRGQGRGNMACRGLVLVAGVEGCARGMQITWWTDAMEVTQIMRTSNGRREVYSTCEHPSQVACESSSRCDRVVALPVESVPAGLRPAGLEAMIATTEVYATCLC